MVVKKNTSKRKSSKNKRGPQKKRKARTVNPWIQTLNRARRNNVPRFNYKGSTYVRKTTRRPNGGLLISYKKM